MKKELFLLSRLSMGCWKNSLEEHKHGLISKFLHLHRASAGDYFHHIYTLCETRERQQSMSKSTLTRAGYCTATRCNWPWISCVECSIRNKVGGEGGNHLSASVHWVFTRQVKMSSPGWHMGTENWVRQQCLLRFIYVITQRELVRKSNTSDAEKCSVEKQRFFQALTTKQPGHSILVNIIYLLRRQNNKCNVQLEC